MTKTTRVSRTCYSKVAERLTRALHMSKDFFLFYFIFKNNKMLLGLNNYNNNKLL
jgi:hypothetical protein